MGRSGLDWEEISIVKKATELRLAWIEGTEKSQEAGLVPRRRGCMVARPDAAFPGLWCRIFLAARRRRASFFFFGTFCLLWSSQTDRAGSLHFNSSTIFLTLPTPSTPLMIPKWMGIIAPKTLFGNTKRGDCSGYPKAKPFQPTPLRSSFAAFVFRSRRT
jgi:hypothetical protein